MTRQQQVTDSTGRTVTIPDNPQRLLALVPSLTELLFVYGWGDAVVGVTDFCTEPAAQVASKPNIGGTKNPHIDNIIELAPQLVFAVQEENRRVDVEQLTAAGIAVYVFEPRSVRDGIDLLWQSAALLACTAAVRPLIERIESEYAHTLEIVARQHRVRVFCPIWKSPYMTINEDTYVHDMLAVCGGDNIFANRQRRFPLAADLGQLPHATGQRDANKDRRYPRIRLEEMAARLPDVILLPDEPYPFSASDLSDFDAFADVPAVRHGRIHLIDGKLVSWYGPRIGDSLQTLRHLLLGS